MVDYNNKIEVCVPHYNISAPIFKPAV